MRRLTTLILLMISAAQSNGQNPTERKEIHFTIANEEKKLTELISVIAWDGSGENLSGIFQRRIQKIDVDQTETYSKLHQFLPYLELNYIHLRFSDFDAVRLDKNGTPFAIGKVFMSERYIESDYYDRFRQATDYEHDKDGFYYYCKIYFDTKNIEQRLIIYPHFLSNICKKQMHLNDVTCPDITGRDIHDRSIRVLISIPDTYYGDFLSENSYNTPSELGRNMREDIGLFELQNPGSVVNFRSALLQTDGGGGFKARLRKNSLSVFVNHTKYMKIFRVTKETEQSGRIANATLTLIHSKKTDSEDFSDNLHYDYNFLRYKEKPLSQPISEFVEFTNNAANRRLIFSEKPDDEFVPGKKRVFNQISFSTDGNSGIDGCRNDPGGFVPCLERLKERLNVLESGLISKNDSLSKEMVTLKTRLSNTIDSLKKQQDGRINDSIYAKTREKARLTVAKTEVRTLLNPVNVSPIILNKDSTATVSIEEVQAFEMKLNDIKDELMANNFIRLQNNLNVAYEQDLVNLLLNKLKNAQTDEIRASIVRDNSVAIIAKLKQVENISVAAIQKREITLDKEIGRYKQDQAALNDGKNDNVNRLKNIESQILSEQQAEYDVVTAQLAAVKDSLKLVSQDKTTIDREVIKSRIDLSNVSGFIYVDSMMAKRYEALITSNQKTRITYFYNLFQNSFYIRKSLPEMLSDTIYFKGEISEIYEPFNFNKAEVKNRFKALAEPGNSWKKALRDSVTSVLANNSWNPETPVTGHDTTLYMRNLKDVGLYRITDQKTKVSYYWLRIPQHAVELVPYMNYFFNKRPKRKECWKVKYRDEIAGK